MKRWGILSLFICCLLPLLAQQNVDVTSSFTGCWNNQEQVTHNADGTITYKATTWGGLVWWIGGDDWTEYSKIVFELASPAPCAVQPIISYNYNEWERKYHNAGVTDATLDLNPDKRHSVIQVAFQTAEEATITIRRIFLVKDNEPANDNEQDARMVINELMQSNIDCIMDDLKEFPDSWVELYNAGNASARLSQYSIGITPDASQAWHLPDMNVKAGIRVMIWCDKVANGLHTDFRLESGKGCAVYLFKDDILIDCIEGLKKQPAPNIAYGRQSDGDSVWNYQLTPTPGGANRGGTCSHDHILGQPLFSKQGCVVTGNGSLTLQLSIPDGQPEGTELRYTTDGTEPTRQSPVYTTPITVSGNTVIRARLFCQGWLSPRSTTHSYIFFPRQLTLPVVSIATDQRYLDDSSIGIFTNNDGNKRKDWRRPINIEYFEGADTESIINQLCETRVSGAASRGAQKKSMALYAHKRFGTKRFTHEFFPTQCPGLDDYKSLVLRNAGNDFDYLYMRDALAQRAMAEHADLDWQAWQPTIVYINGRYYGMLNLRERANENNVYTHYDGLEDIDLIENWGDLKEGTWEAFEDFRQFYEQPGHTLEEYEQWMDCGEFANLMIMNLYFNNLDFPGNNIVMWRPRTPITTGTGQQYSRWRWIAKDCDYTIGLYGQANASYNIFDWLYNPNYDNGANWGANNSSATLLFRQLMETEGFRNMFIDRCAVYLGTFLSYQNVRTLWDDMYAQISYEYPYHRNLINRWWPNYANELSNARSWLLQRQKPFLTHLGIQYGLGTVEHFTVTPQGNNGNAVPISFNGIPLEHGSMSGMYYAGRTVTLQGIAHEGRQVSSWKVQQFGGSSPGTRQFNGDMLSFVMPECQSIVITPVIGIDLAVNSPQHSSFNWTITGGRLYLASLTPGTHITLTDLQGRILVQATANGTDMVLPIRTPQVCLLHVGDSTAKIFCR